MFQWYEESEIYYVLSTYMGWWRPICGGFRVGTRSSTGARDFTVLQNNAINNYCDNWLQVLDSNTFT